MSYGSPSQRVWPSGFQHSQSRAPSPLLSPQRETPCPLAVTPILPPLDAWPLSASRPCGPSAQLLTTATQLPPWRPPACGSAFNPHPALGIFTLELLAPLMTRLEVRPPTPPPRATPTQLPSPPALSPTPGVCSDWPPPDGPVLINVPRATRPPHTPHATHIHPPDPHPTHVHTPPHIPPCPHTPHMHTHTPQVNNTHTPTPLYSTYPPAPHTHHTCTHTNSPHTHHAHTTHTHTPQHSTYTHTHSHSSASTSLGILPHKHSLDFSTDLWLDHIMLFLKTLDGVSLHLKIRSLTVYEMFHLLLI